MRVERPRRRRQKLRTSGAQFTEILKVSGQRILELLKALAF